MTSQSLINSLIVGNKRTKIYHKTNCHHVRKEMNMSNHIELDSDFKDTKGNWYRPCGHCRPFSKWFDARMDLLAEENTHDLYNKGQDILNANRRESLADSCIIECVD